MKIENYYVSVIEDIGIERTDERGNSVVCKGYYCQVYDDPAYGNEIDNFCLAIGYDIPDDKEESLVRGIRTYLNLECEDISKSIAPIGEEEVEEQDDAQTQQTPV